MEKLSVVSHEDIKAALVTTFPEDNLCLYQRTVSGVPIDTYYVAFYRPPRRMAKVITFNNTKGADGNFWKAEIKALDKCNSCSAPTPHDNKDPCPAWKHLFNSDHSSKNAAAKGDAKGGKKASKKAGKKGAAATGKGKNAAKK